MTESHERKLNDDTFSSDPGYNLEKRETHKPENKTDEEIDEDIDEDDFEEDEDDVFDDDGRVYKNPRNSPSPLCPRDEEQATLLVIIFFPPRRRLALRKKKLIFLPPISGSEMFEKMFHGRRLQKQEKEMSLRRPLRDVVHKTRYLENF